MDTFKARKDATSEGEAASGEGEGEEAGSPQRLIFVCICFICVVVCIIYSGFLTFFHHMIKSICSIKT